MSNSNISFVLNRATAVTAIAGAALASTVAFADPLSYASLPHAPQRVVEQILPTSAAAANLHATENAAHLRRRVVDYPTREAPGTIVSIPRTPTSIWCWAAAGPSVTESV